MRKYYLALDKYWVTQSGYFRLATTVLLGTGITITKILLCNGISEQRRDKNNLMREYNVMLIYDRINTHFTVYFGGPALNIPLMNLEDSFRPKKRSCYTPDPLPAATYVIYRNYVSTLNSTS